MDLLGVALAVLAAALLGAVVVLARRSFLLRPGTFACSLRRQAPGGRDGARERGSVSGWSYGVARYHGDRLEWFRLFSLSPRPKHVLLRRELRLRSRREAEAAEIPPGAMVVTCTLVPAASRAPDGAGAAAVELAMSRDAMTGFLSWVEATSPGGPMVT